MKTAELIGHALDLEVAKCEGYGAHVSNLALYIVQNNFNPSTNWEQGGPIIEREKITVIRCDDDYETDSEDFTTDTRIPVWAAEHGGLHESSDSYGEPCGTVYEIDESACSYGPTPLIAAMRCYVASKVGDEVDIPDELT